MFTYLELSMPVPSRVIVVSCSAEAPIMDAINAVMLGIICQDVGTWLWRV